MKPSIRETAVTPAKHLRLTAEEAWALYVANEHAARHAVYAPPGGRSLPSLYRVDACRLRRAIRVGQRFRASDLRHKWHVTGVSNILERGLWAGVLIYEGKDGLERVYRRVK